MKKKVDWDEFNYRLEKAKSCFDRIASADTGVDLRRSWEEFVNAFGLTIGWLISNGMNFKVTRGWAHKLKNHSSKDDEGLLYLREARNHTEHGLTPFSDFREAFVGVGGIGPVSGTSSVHYSNNIVIRGGVAVNTGTFSLETKNGNLTKLSGAPNTHITENLANVRLLPIYNPKKKLTVRVPTHIGGKRLSASNPEEFANLAIEYIEEKSAELKHLLDQISR
ncbi:hypothetical protein ACFQFQ_07085 [Sulfitobacter porphyrae]|uniref:Uncharacterized protein n=1 Tax=Sulfitobacter porphyrae TaxID=1246864 RepID=A0ABW2B176_9RHOB|nr:hypothetical protein GCM10007928_45530 [Sulfitobacter porphyrae]